MSVARKLEAAGASAVETREGGPKNRHGAWDWAVAALLFAPMWVVYALHFLCVPEGLAGTGFLQYDQPYYMANAREHFDGGFFPLYGLPYSFDYDTPRLYFQPLTLMLGVLWRLSGIDPGWVYATFGALAGVAFFRVAIALYRSHCGSPGGAEFSGLLCLVWGGGFFAAANALGDWRSLSLSVEGVSRLLFLSSAIDYWFLNLGRNVFYATEAGYHVLALGLILGLRQQRYRAALAMAAFLSISHPFTGIQFLLILFVWSCLEAYGIPSARLPRWLPRAAGGLIFFHFSYYFGILSLSEEYIALRQQWYLRWSLPAESAALAYGPVVLFAVFGIRREARAHGWRLSPGTRLLLVWALVSAALVHHDWIMRPIQPLHFSRGYVWTPLFLLGLPVLRALFVRLLGMRPRPLGAALAWLLACIWLLDNIVWFSWQIGATVQGSHRLGFTLSHEERAAFRELHGSPYRKGLILGDDPELSYLAMTYTPLRAWFSHFHNTPHRARRSSELRRFRDAGVEPAVWGRARMVFVLTGAWAEGVQRLPQYGFRKTWSRGSISLYVREPRRPEPRNGDPQRIGAGRCGGAGKMRSTGRLVSSAAAGHFLPGQAHLELHVPDAEAVAEKSRRDVAAEVQASCQGLGGDPAAGAFRGLPPTRR